MPYLGNFSLNWMGQIGVISMVGAIAYAIMKHKLFDMKVLATQFIVAVLCISLFTKVLFSVDQKDVIINSSFLFITLIVGIFLIRSVIREVRQREEIQKLADDLKIANQGQASLMHFMNHQVKGRFGNAKNIFAELLTDDYGVMPPDAKPLLEKGLDETNLGINYVQNILKGASAENGTLPIEMKPIDFRKVVEVAATKQRPYAEAKGLSFELKMQDSDYSMSGDELQLGEAVRNLIDNSINYTQQGSIAVILGAVGKTIRFMVKDTGFGLTDEDKTKLFKSGGRGTESLKVNTNSTGYGLVFVKGVVEAHKGKVWAESAGRGKGSTFIVELPRA
jgi:signal transduction histidine kinase